MAAPQRLSKTGFKTVWVSRTAQWVGVVLLGVLLWGLFARPEATLRVFWKGVVPLLPITFLVSPSIWRSVCPMASLNMVGNSESGSRRIAKRLRPVLEMSGIGILFLVVPARTIVFNQDAVPLAVLLFSIGLWAFISGFFFDKKAGFCNSICPILPVEKLYGQFPLVALNNTRCPDCSLCTPKGCLDLAHGKALSQSLGPNRSEKTDHDWLARPYGAFSVSFPGFVIGYFIVARASVSSPILMYLFILGAAVLSFGLALLLVRTLHVQQSHATIVTAGLAAAIYYWFVTPDLVSLVGLDAPAAVSIIQFGTVAFVCFWVYRAFLVGRAGRRHQSRPQMDGIQRIPFPK